MGWKGTIRSMQAAQRRYEREARRRQRELEKQQAYLAKMEEQERAAYEVEVHENEIDILVSIHKSCSVTWNWQSIQSSLPPVKPTRSTRQYDAAMAELEAYKPGMADKMLRRADAKRAKLQQAAEAAKQADSREYHDAVKTYERDLADWQQTRDLADKILSGDVSAYVECVQQANPFSECNELGLSVAFATEHSSYVEATLHVNDEGVVPTQSKTLLKSGKLSVKNMTKTRYYEIYQDHVSACVLRVARELHALLPIEMAIVTAETDLLNTQTGHMERTPILSAAIPRSTLESLNFDMLDPSDAMQNFVHRMKFLKTKGFRPIDALTPADLQLAA